VGETNPFPFLGVIRHKTTHEVHDYRVGSKLDKVMLDRLKELRIDSLA
jgi:hypothetical protein